MSDKIYCGKGRKSKFGIKLNLNLSKIPDEHISEWNEMKFVRLEVLESRQPDDKGNTHYVVVDTFKPQSQTNERE